MGIASLSMPALDPLLLFGTVLHRAAPTRFV
jgi:hypothetical protein